MTFELDTSGFVHGWVQPHGERKGYAGPNRFSFDDLDPFTQGYVEAALTWAAERFSFEFKRDRVRHAQFSDLAPETLARIVEDCAKALADWQQENQNAPEYGARFWKDRQADHLNGMEPRFPPLAAHLGDDGKIYFKEAN